MNPIAAAKEIMRRYAANRLRNGISEDQIEEDLILGPGWVSEFESGRCIPSLDVLIALALAAKCDIGELFRGINIDSHSGSVQRYALAVPSGKDLTIRFRYSQFDAEYILRKASMAEYESVVTELREGLARLEEGNETSEPAIKRDAVVRSFSRAVELWPQANPSDIWWFIIYRAYCDPFNHPARYSRLSFEQSWKRTAGWALEEILVRHYSPFLESRGVRMFIGVGDEKQRLVDSLQVDGRIEADKVDVLLTGVKNGEEVCFGVVHVKSSFAERRTDDVPLSQALVRAGYTSPLWTMDCKSTPCEKPVNKGELGTASPHGTDRRNAKRKDIEKDGYFSACFSYNHNTVPTPDEQDARAKVYVCNFKNADDAFAKFVLSEWRRQNA